MPAKDKFSVSPRCVLTLLDSIRLILSSTNLVLGDLVDRSLRLGGPTRLVTSPVLDVACSIKQVVQLSNKQISKPPPSKLSLIWRALERFKHHLTVCAQCL